MLENLKRKYVDIYSLPSETEIRTEISSLFQKSKGDHGEQDGDEENNETTRRILQPWIQLLDTLVGENINTRPRDIYDLFIESNNTNNVQVQCPDRTIISS